MPANINPVWEISDSRRDADRYHNLLLALERATGKIKDLGEESYASIDEVLGELLPDLTLALNAEQAFVAVLQAGDNSGKKWLNLTAVYPRQDLCGHQLAWSNVFQQLINDGKPKIIDPLGAQAQTPISGLEIFKATSTLLVRVQAAGQVYVVGVCNKANPNLGPFLAADGLALNNIVELVTIGARVGEQRRRELEGIQSTSAVISAELDLDELLPLIAKRAAEVFDAPATSLMLWDESGDNLTISAQWGLSDEYARRQRIPKEKVVDTAFTSTGKIAPLLTPDLQLKPFGNPDIIKREGLRTVLSAPLLVRDQVTGVLNIYSKDEVRQFTPYEQELSQIFANQTAIAVQNAALYAGVESRAQQLQDALKAGQNITALRPIRDVLQAITNSLVADFGYDVVTLFPYQAESNTFDPPVITGHLRFPDIVLGKVTADALVEKRLRGPEFHFTSTSPEDTLLAGRFTEREGIQASGYVRLNVGGEVVGILFVNYRKPHNFTGDEQGAVRLFGHQAAIAIHNTRQFEALQNQLDQFEMMLAAGQGIIAKKPLRETLQLILNQLIKVEGYDIATLIPYHELRDTLGHTLVAGQLQNYTEVIGQFHEGSVAARRLKTGPDEYFTSDAANDPLLAGPFIKRERVRAVGSIRLKYGEQIVGLLFVNKRETHTFTRRERENLQLYANQTALVLHEARLLRRVRERLEMLTRIGQEVGQSLQLETVLDTLYTQLKAIFGAAIWPNVLLYDEVSHNLHFLYPEKFGLSIDIKDRQDQMMIKSGQGICGWVAKHKQALNISDVKTEPRYLEMLQTTRSELTVPILLGERLVGVLDVESSEPGKFKEDDQRLLEAVANQVAAAIRNAEQYESLKKRRQQQRALHEAGKAITRAGLEIEAVLQAILHQAVAVTGATFGTIHLLRKNNLAFVAAWPPERLEWLRRKIGRMPLDGPGITVRTVKLNDAQLVPDISRDPDFVNSTGETGSELAVVLRRGGHREGQLIGVLNVEHQEVGGLDREDRNLLIALSNLAVVALQNAEQYEELQEARDYGLATEDVAWLGLFGADWQHTINQKTFSIGNYIDALRRGMAKCNVPYDVLTMVDQALDGIEDVTDSIRTVQFTGRVPSGAPGEADGETMIDPELRTIVTRWCHDHENVEKIFNLTCSEIHVRIPPQWLRVAMEKLILNALKAMPDGGKITVSTEQIDDMVHITVEDTGHGIPDYALADFLKRTIRRPDGIKKDGTGKGAIIASFVARSYGGNLSLVHTQKDKGTKLLMMLPMLVNNSNS